jgi:Zn-dependent peptidase ImmA (M78 family)
MEMNWGEAHRIAMVAAAHAHFDLHIDLERRIDVFGVIKAEGLVLGFQPCPQLSGAYISEPDAKAGIFINANHPLARQRYSAAHELGHHLLGHGTSVDPETDPLYRWGSGPPPDREKVAEAFAAWFLMPRQLVRRCMSELGVQQPREDIDVYRLSLRLGTSYEATARHLPNLRLATDESTASWLKTEPAAIKRRLAGSWIPHNLQNDVWDLTLADDGATIALRPGDRVIARLPETPSSGHFWRLEQAPAGCVLVGDDYTDTTEAPVQENLFTTAPIPQSGSTAQAGTLVGQAAHRLLVLDIAPDAPAGHETIQFVKGPPWDPSIRTGSFRLEIRIEPAQRGVPESYFAGVAA